MRGAADEHHPTGMPLIGWLGCSFHYLYNTQQLMTACRDEAIAKIGMTQGDLWDRRRALALTVSYHDFLSLTNFSGSLSKAALHPLEQK